MQIDHLEYINQPEHQDQVKAFNLDIEIIPVEDFYLLDFQANINPQYANLFVNQTFILFVLELRSGMSPQAINVLRGCILGFCEQALQKNLNGFGFVINGEYYTIKKPNYEAIKEILNTYMVVSKEDNYFSTLRKLRHILEKQIYKYDRKVEYIDMVFFTSFVEIDHSLGVKKRSYINQLNQHCQDCFKEVDRIRSFLDKNMRKYNAHVIGLEKNGQKDQDYSLADRDLFYKISTTLGQISSIILFYWVEEEDPSYSLIFDWGQKYTQSFKRMSEGFQRIASSVLSTSLSFLVEVPIETDSNKQKYMNFSLSSSDTTKYKAEFDIFLKKQEISLDKLYNNEVKISSKKIEALLGEDQKAQQQQIKDLYQIRSVYTKLDQKDVQFGISCRIRLYNQKLSTMCQQLKEQIISFKRIYDGNNKSHLEMIVNEDKQQEIKNTLFYIEERSKEIYQQIFNPKFFPTKNEKECTAKREAFELYSSLKKKIDISHEVLMNIYKRQIKNDQIGKISQAVTFWAVRNSLKNKLVRRVNLNPKMIDQTYARVHQIVSKNEYVSLETTHKNAKHAIGYCIKSGVNFATALRKEDCLGVLIEVERPDSAIADPGRIKIRQISPFAMTVSNFFNVYHYGIDSLGQLNEEKGGEWAREYAKLQKENYQEMWDYWGLVQKKHTVTAIVPVFLCKQHWQVAKLLMKPCLGWTATGEPLGYTFSQAQTIPFMILSFAIRKVQQITYEIETLERKFQKNEFKVTEYSKLQRDTLDKKLLKKRMQDLCWVLEETCFQIMKDMSSEAFEEKLSEVVINKYRNYIQHPIQRTIDVISNNSAFLAQLFCVIKLEILKKPQETEFHEFFKRLVEEELRRETDGWNEEQTQDTFINKLLNSEVENMDVPEYFVLGSEFYDNFELLRRGQIVHKTYFQITRSQLEMMITKNGKFNDTQRMLLIEYKRLYENRVLWMWYVRFRLYQEIDRVKVHKWNCIDLRNSYMLFTMIIQNKRQRKNYKRRQAILRNEYVDPFDEQQTRQYLQLEFMRLRSKKEKQNLNIINNQKYGNSAATFVYTKSLQEAAGTLINFDLGHQCHIFFRQMERGQGVRMEQKLKMILLGQYKNVNLFRGWKMSRRKNTKLRKVYPEIFQKFGYMC